MFNITEPIYKEFSRFSMFQKKQNFWYDYYDDSHSIIDNSMPGF